MTAGMDGVVGDENYDTGAHTGMRANVPQPNGLRAGSVLVDGVTGPGFGAVAGNPVAFDAAMNQGNGFGMMPGFEGNDAALMFGMGENGTGQSVRHATGNRPHNPRRPVRKSTKKPTNTKLPSAGKLESLNKLQSLRQYLAQ
jgi:hypothetical protein